MYDEFKHIGVDFADPQQVQTYDARQKTSLERAAQLVQRWGIRSGDVVIEYGSGTGAFALAAAMRAARVTAVDISRPMLDYARSKAQQLGVMNVSFVNSGFLSYQQAAESADMIVTEFAFHHLPDFWKAVALRRIINLLKPGGALYLHDVVFSFEADQYEQRLGEWIDSVASDAGTGFSRADFEQHIRDEYSTFSWILEGLLRRAGFSIVEQNYLAPTYAEYLCRKG
jgi:ubiquinone/menaquinone biosynthesis C-methylase UbiE